MKKKTDELVECICYIFTSNIVESKSFEECLDKTKKEFWAKCNEAFLKEGGLKAKKGKDGDIRFEIIKGRGE